MEKANRSAHATAPDGNDSHLRLRSNQVTTARFAGRLSGNQEFIAEPDSEETQSLLKRQPDAVRSPDSIPPCGIDSL
jgi:hypothetical protein